MPKIGLRNIKTAVAIFICLMLNVVLIAIFGQKTARDWYTPFFAGIATCYSMQANRSSSFRQARIRSIGSIIGGIFGMCILMFFEWAFEDWAQNVGGEAFAKVVQYTIVALCAIIVIHITVVTKQTSATFITLLTYLSVTVSIRNGGLSAPVFAVNRILSTIIGVLVSLMVNVFRLPHRKNPNVLFVCGLDGSLLDKEKRISGFIKYRLNYLINTGANITIATTRTPASLSQILEGINFKLPLIIMNGAALYDFSTKKYINVVNIDKDICVKIEKFFTENEMNYFAHAIIDDILYIYYQKLDNEGAKRFYHERKNANFKNYVRGVVPNDENTAFYIIIDHSEKVLKLKEELQQMEIAQKLVLTCYKHEEYEGYHFLKIHSASASKIKAAHTIPEFKDRYMVALGAREFDAPIMEESNYSIALNNADDQVKEISNCVLKSNNPDSLVKTMDKIYHCRKINKKDTMKNSSEE